MDKKSGSFLVLGLLVGVVVTTGIFSFLVGHGPAGQQDKTVLKLAHALPKAAPVHKAMEYMAQRAAEISGGKLEIQVFPNGQLGSETETIEQLQRGVLAMVKTSTAPMEGFIPEMAVFSVPYLFRSEDHFWKTINSDIGQNLLLQGQDVGIRGVCYYDAGARSFYTVPRPVLKPSDVKGLKIRVMNSKTAIEMVSTFGGSATPIPFGELYSALQQGMVDGAENNPPSMYDSRHWEVVKNYSLDEHARIPDLIIFSEKIWEGMSPQEQEWLMQAAKESVEFQKQVWAEYVDECLTKLEDEGVKIYHPDKSKFQEVASQMYTQFDGTEVGKLITKIQEIQ